MTTEELISLSGQYVMNTYRRFPLVLVRGAGVRVWDSDGREYLDMAGGIAVCSLGHAHPKVTAAIQEQAAKLLHVSNLYHIEPQIRFARMLVEHSFADKVFFCNSGAEANEAALKLARLHTPKEKYKYITAEGSFHGRTFATVTATAQPKYHEGFLPLLPGFIYVPFNDVKALEKAFTDEVAGVLVEPIQGEGGINVATPEYLRAIRGLCDRHGAVMILDEVQTGIGRTGKWFAYQHYDVEPDVITMAKALGGGVAIGAMMAKPEVAACLVPGKHASTFGGNSLACAAGIAVIETIEQDHLLEHAAKLGAYTQQKLLGLKAKHPVIDSVRGIGLMIGVQLTAPGAQIVQRCLDKGLRINCTHDTVLRFMPPMIATQEQIDQAVSILDGVMSETAQ